VTNKYTFYLYFSWTILFLIKTVWDNFGEGVRGTSTVEEHCSVWHYHWKYIRRWKGNWRVVPFYIMHSLPERMQIGMVTSVLVITLLVITLLIIKVQAWRHKEHTELSRDWRSVWVELCELFDVWRIKKIRDIIYWSSYFNVFGDGFVLLYSFFSTL
jgi:hypothetical protein